MEDEYTAAGACRRLRGDRLDRGAALVHGQRRDDGNQLGRVQQPAGRGAAAAGAEGDRHAVLDRRPLRRRHPLQGRLPAEREPRLGGDDVGLFLAPARSGAAATTGARCGSTGWSTSRSCPRSGCAISGATPTGGTARCARTRRRSRPRCWRSAAGATATRTRRLQLVETSQGAGQGRSSGPGCTNTRISPCPSRGSASCRRRCAGGTAG